MRKVDFGSCQQERVCKKTRGRDGRSEEVYGVCETVRRARVYTIHVEV